MPEKIWLCFTMVFWFLRVCFAWDVNKEPLVSVIYAGLTLWFITGWIPYLIIKFL